MNPFKAMGQSIARRIVAAAGWGPVVPSGQGNWTGAKIGSESDHPALWDADYRTLRARSRQARFESIQGRALTSVLDKNVVGSGLVLEYAPAWDIIDPQGLISAEDRRAFVKNVQLRWDLTMRSKDLDASGRLTGYELQGFEFSNRVVDGETFPVFRYLDGPWRLTPLTVQFIQPDQVDTPPGRAFYSPDDKIRIVDGIEIDQSGRELAIHVKDPLTYQFTRLPMSGPTRQFVLHPMLLEAIGQVRGMPHLAPFVHDLEGITSFDVAELASANINASIAAVVEPSDEFDSSKPFKAGGGPQLRGAAPTNDTPVEATSSSSVPIWKRPGMILQALKKGEKFKQYDTNRPSVNVEAYIMGKLKHMSAATGIAVEVLLQAFNANYSASKAAIEITWNTFEQWVYRCVAGFQIPLFKAWLGEEIAAGRIVAPGWGVPILREAYLKCEWTGVRKPSLDPLKEASAAAAWVKAGFSTREREALLHNGSEYAENIARLKEENAALAEVNAPLEAPAAAAPGAGSSDGEQTGGTPSPDDIKAAFDGYGVGVRAGVVTPQPEDEVHFRTLAGLPAMTQAVVDAWDEDGNVRRPITLTQPEAETPDSKPTEKTDTPPEEK